MKRYAAAKVRGAGPSGADAGTAPGRPGPFLLGQPFDMLSAACCLPRKEVIQPHVPVRLPCYDFTPLTLHTFDASAPRGFGRRLRVQTTRVV